MNSEVNEAVKVYRKLVKNASPISGRISSSRNASVFVISSTWSQVDLERSADIRSIREDVLRAEVDQMEILSTTCHQELANELFRVSSRSGFYTAILREVKLEKEEKRYIEIWRNNCKLQNIDVEAQGKHGRVYNNDGQFGTLQWSHAGDRLLYVAEKKQVKSTSYFNETTSCDDCAKKATKGDEYLYKDDWGMCLNGKHHPVICIVNLDTEQVNVLHGVSDDLSAGVPIWCPDDSGIIFTAWCHNPCRLGIIYLMRQSAIYHYNLSTHTCNRLSQDKTRVLSPRFKPDGTCLVWLQSDHPGIVQTTCKLVKYDWASGVISTVVDVVQKYSRSAFLGLYALSSPAVHIPERPWAQDGRRLVLDNAWRFNNEIITIDVVTGEVTRMTSGDVEYWNVLDVAHGFILACHSSVVESDSLRLGRLPQHGAEIDWLPLVEPVISRAPYNYQYLIHKLADHQINPQFPSITEFESLLITPPGASPTNKVPLVLSPHGGPHARWFADFSVTNAILLECGFAVLMVNYRGSVAYGNEMIWSLPGSLGEMDVRDCIQAVRETLDLGLYDADSLCVYGGSHGGTIAAYIIGQHPDLFRAAAVRNPLLNHASMYHTTDMPDWTHLEILDNPHSAYDPKFIPGPEEYRLFWERSPIRYVDQVKTPLLLMLAGRDRRVPCAQGLEYYRHLRVRNIPAKLLMYADSDHPLSEVHVDADRTINIIDWFKRHTAHQKHSNNWLTNG